jgi:toxin ParE1/3/4
MDNRILFAPEASAALFDLRRSLAHRDGEVSADAFVERFEAWCEAVSDFPERGIRRDDLFPGLRILGFERRMAVAFHLGLDTVTIDLIAHGAHGRSRFFDGPPGSLSPATFLQG